VFNNSREKVTPELLFPSINENHVGLMRGVVRAAWVLSGGTAAMGAGKKLVVESGRKKSCEKFCFLPLNKRCRSSR